MHYKASYIIHYEALKERVQDAGLELIISRRDSGDGFTLEEDRHEFVLLDDEGEVVHNSQFSANIETWLEGWIERDKRGARQEATQ